MQYVSPGSSIRENKLVLETGIEIANGIANINKALIAVAMCIQMRLEVGAWINDFGGNFELESRDSTSASKDFDIEFDGPN